MSKVSFIVIGKNEGWRLEKCLASIPVFVEKEGISDYETIYVDSKSTDNSIETAKQFNTDKIFSITGVCNAAIGRNIGAKESSGEILFFLDGDMELIPGFWHDIVDEQGNLQYPFVSGIEVDVLHDNDWNYMENKVRRSFVEGKDQYNLTTGGLFAVSRELWEMAGGMDNRQTKSQDFDLGIRLSNIGTPLLRKGRLWVNHYTTYYTIRSHSARLVQIKNTSRLIRKHFFNLKLHRHLLPSTYSYWFFLVCVLAVLVSGSYYPGVVYLLMPACRTVKDISKTKTKMPLLSTFYHRIEKDILIWFYLLTYWPRKPKVEYREHNMKQ